MLFVLNLSLNWFLFVYLFFKKHSEKTKLSSCTDNLGQFRETEMQMFPLI